MNESNKIKATSLAVALSRLARWSKSSEDSGPSSWALRLVVVTAINSGLIRSFAETAAKQMAVPCYDVNGGSLSNTNTGDIYEGLQSALRRPIPKTKAIVLISNFSGIEYRKQHAIYEAWANSITPGSLLIIGLESSELINPKLTWPGLRAAGRHFELVE